MSDTQLFFIYTAFFSIAGAFVRYMLSSSFGVLRPYQDGVLRSYSSRAKKAVWIARFGIVIAFFILCLIYARMGVYCAVVYALGYFISTFITNSLEEDLGKHEILEAASISKAVQA